MAIPKGLREIPKDRALRLIKKHLDAGTGEWEGKPDYSDFVYKSGNGYKLIRPPYYGFGEYETGKVCL